MRRCLAAICLAALSCASSAEVRDQWLITLGTDAAVPQLGDRLLVEILTEDGQLACTGCRRLFSRAAAEAWPVSFGVVHSEAAALVRARLYRSALTGPDGLPQGSALLDRIGRLPPARGLTRLGLVLETHCFAAEADLEQGLTCAGGETVPIPVLVDEALPAVGSAEFFASSPCNDVPEGMVCVPGGALILGSPRASAADPEFAEEPERLVRVSSFALDDDEFSVGALRESLPVLAPAEHPQQRADPASEQGGCTFIGAGSAENDALPANCLPRSAAEKLCAARGKRLPTEAEWEYAAGNLAAESPYPWGSDDDVCSHAVVGLGRHPAEANVFESDSCRTAGDVEALPWGPVAGGNAEDKTTLGVSNLGGSMAEFVAGAFAGYEDACWGGPLVVDPRCGAASDGSQLFPVRGGSWASREHDARVTAREAVSSPGSSPLVGFRCALTL